MHGNTGQRQWVDPATVTEALVKLEGGSTVLAAALLNSEEWPPELAAEHALAMSEQAARLLAVGMQP